MKRDQDIKKCGLPKLEVSHNGVFIDGKEVPCVTCVSVNKIGPGLDMEAVISLIVREVDLNYGEG